eukprot:CAMPEP_0198301502 /NCGR_PEP_ID=MMETSP1449-20131203/51841_1 /TAXON_ID=420275 /ORGANISM="Attheya septentrionalis, Strain CCMP2084" /LENGTH=340 /DNA_ID=CAMNT_0044003599 /DNA_START=140 /DNA_END=1162 /DNA_ORIENTATION=-
MSSDAFESHLREIKAYYLDQILQTNLVLPCVGYNFSFSTLQFDSVEKGQRYEQLIHKNLECSNSTTDTSIAFEGSMMLWMDGLEQLKLSQIFEAATGNITTGGDSCDCSTCTSSVLGRDADGSSISGRIQWSIDNMGRSETQACSLVCGAEFPGICEECNPDTCTSNPTPPAPTPPGVVTPSPVTPTVPQSGTATTTTARQESAIRYSILHYLGACMKSDHNHFGHTNGLFVAIDNDRCLTPSHVYAYADPIRKLHITQFRKLVLEELCVFPKNIVELVKQSSSSKDKISQQLIQSLRDDVLAEQLLQSQPEAFGEIDERVDKLALHIESCREKGDLVLF